MEIMISCKRSKIKALPFAQAQISLIHIGWYIMSSTTDILPTICGTGILQMMRKSEQSTTSLSVVLTSDIFLHVGTMQKTSHHRVNTPPPWLSPPACQNWAHHTKTIADTKLPMPHNPRTHPRQQHPKQDCLDLPYFFRSNPTTIMPILLHFLSWPDVMGIRPFSCW